MTASRKLAAILAADVVGYSRMMGEDEAGTAGLVRERREAAQPIIASHGGRLFKIMGDGMFVEFPSVVAAVECALAIQSQTAASNNGAKGASGSTPSANTSDGPVTVAAAIVIHHLGGQSTARVGDGANITTSGALSLKNESDLDAQSDTSGV